MEEGHLDLKVELRCSTRKYLAPYGLEEVEMQHEGHRLTASGDLYVSPTEDKRPVTPSLLSIDTPGDKRNLPVEKRMPRSEKARK